MDARRSARAVACLLALLWLALVVPALAASTAATKLTPVTGKLATKIGIADQKAAIFDDERLRDLGVGYVRRSVAWDVLRYASQRADLDAWVNGARLMGAEPLITLARSGTTTGRRYRPPTPTQYLREFLRLRKRYPTVKTWSAWNEANMCGVGTCEKPELVARYYRVLRRNCPGCKVVAADLLDQPNMVGWVRAFRRAAHYEPKYWGLHGYIDANRFQTTRTAALLRAVRGEVWLTEVGGLVARRNSSQVKLRQGKAHAASATRFVFQRLARLDRRVARIYIYHWQSSTAHDSWDSALVGADGKARPALAVVKRALGETMDARHETS
jgi:polysaccharide biosynthesis protein PslG